MNMGTATITTVLPHKDIYDFVGTFEDEKGNKEPLD